MLACFWGSRKDPACLSDPPHRVGDELDVLAFLERVVLLGSLHQTEVALLDEVEERHIRVAVALRVGDDEAEVGFDEAAQGLHVSVLDPLRQLDLVFVGQGGVPGDLLQVAAKGRRFSVLGSR